jgi:hypothetical protein
MSAKKGEVRLRPCLNKSLKNKKKIAIHNNDEGYFQLRFRPCSAVADFPLRAIMTDPNDHHVQRVSVSSR